MTSGIRIIPQNVAPTPEPAPDPLKEREAAFNAVLMAVMAGRRVMVLSDGHPDAGRTLGRRMAGHMDSSCGLGLVATAHRGATVEDLLVQVSADLGAGAPTTWNGWPSRWSAGSKPPVPACWSSSMPICSMPAR